VQTHQLY
jgi:cystathionine beta-synthase